MMIFCLLTVLAAGAETAKDVHVRAVSGPTRVEVVAPVPEALRKEVPSGKLTPEQGERWLRLALIDAETGNVGPALFGTYERRGTDLVFAPRYALTHGQRYRATVEWATGQPASIDYKVPAREPMPPAVVEHVYPSSNVLPANHLKFYIHFSRPMREGEEIVDRIRLLDKDGQPVAGPWRRTELWSGDCRRLTLYIHPGRVKEGVNLREELGAVLEPDREYTLVVVGDLQDADGQPLKEAFTKKFRTTAAERSRPLPQEWQVTPPAAATRQPVTLTFHRPLDRALLDRFLTVVDSDGQAVPGRIEVGSEERSWSFHPERPWKAATYQVHVDERLEDLAGNTPLRLFDTDLRNRQLTPPRLTIVIRPR